MQLKAELKTVVWQLAYVVAVVLATYGLMVSAPPPQNPITVLAGWSLLWGVSFVTLSAGASPLRKDGLPWRPWFQCAAWAMVMLGIVLITDFLRWSSSPVDGRVWALVAGGASWAYRRGLLHALGLRRPDWPGEGD